MPTKDRPRWSEGDFTRWYCKCLKRVGAVCIPLVGNAYAGAGWPDRYIAHKSFRGFVEFKSNAGRLRSEQLITCLSLQQCGVVVFIGRIKDDGFFLLQRLNRSGVGEILSSLDIRGLVGRKDEKVLKAGRLFLDQLVRCAKLGRKVELEGNGNSEVAQVDVESKDLLNRNS